MRAAPVWRATLVGAAVTLGVAAAFPWWSGRTGEEFGATPWWLRVPLLVAVFLLLGAQLVPYVARRWTALAALIAGSVAVGGAVLFLTWSRDDAIVAGRREDKATEASNAWWLGATDRELHAVLTAWPEAAPVAVALASAFVAGAALFLAWSWRSWLGLDEPVSGEALRARLRGLAACGMAGVLAGGLLSVAAVEGADRIREARTEALGPWWGEYTESAPVAAADLHRGSRRVNGDDAGPGVPKRPGRITWQRTFEGPVALSMCRRDGRERGTLVVLEEDGGGAVVTGRDARDGSRRWTFTVRTSERVKLRQVAVSEGCSVLALVGSTLISLDSYSGRQRGATVLPMPGRGGWRFITPYRQPEEAPKMVTLPDAGRAHLDGGVVGVVAVSRDDAGLLAQGPARGEGCEYLVDYASEDDPGTLLVGRCGLADVLLRLPQAERETGGATDPDYRTPRLPLLYTQADLAVTWPPGCEGGRVDWIRAGERATRVAGTWECGKGKSRSRMYASRTAAPPDSFSGTDWRFTPADRAPLYPARGLVHGGAAWAVGDSVRIGWDAGDGEWVGRVVPEKGDRVVGLNGSRLHEGDVDTHLALGASGRLTALKTHYTNKGTQTTPKPHLTLKATTSTTTAATPCPGNRTLLTDTASATALIVCSETKTKAKTRTRTTAITNTK